MERPKKQERVLKELADGLSAETGIELDFCLRAAVIAENAFTVLTAPWLNEDEIAKDYVTNNINIALEYAAEQDITLPRDQDGVPLFRIRYAAERILYGLLENDTTTDIQPAINGAATQIVPHYDRMEKMIETLVELQGGNKYPYNLPNAEVPNRSEFMPPEDTLPRGSREHALYLWHVCYWMGGGIESNLAFKNLTNLYIEYPELFKPEYIIEHNVSTEQIQEVIGRYPALNFNLTRIQNYWTENARHLYEDYGSDPRAIFADNPSYRTVKKRLQNTGKSGFLGFQEKMASMYTHFLADGGMISEIPFPPPVDFHLLRLFIANQVITFENVPKDGNVFTPATIAMVRKMLFDYIIATNSSAVEVDDALWRHSKLMCAQAPGNMTEIDYKANRGTKSSLKEVDFSDPTTRTKYARSCGRCALSASCAFAISSGAYYADDRIIPQPRHKPSDEQNALIHFSDDMLAPPVKDTSPSIVQAHAPRLTFEPLF